ncbi:MAG: ParB N-terminal domain-containing protein [Nitrososphaerota archaeon]|nr:ParB N-terminal domain-containing protein [Candidatus Bathyarchaeota archaeon]MDW8022912.1 ParB N-terminal domain-containing protein [Nitrososphaerota archaeon]
MKMLGMLPVESVRPNRWNVNVLPSVEYARLKAVMRISGPERTEPIVVRKAEDGAWEIVNGEQRWKAAKELGWKAIPALEVEGKGEAAKFLCLSFNAVRGHIDLVKLSELLLADPEMAEAVRKVYGGAKLRSLLKALRG